MIVIDASCQFPLPGDCWHVLFGHSTQALKTLTFRGKIVYRSSSERGLTKAAIYANIPAEEIRDKGLVVGVQVVGEKFEMGEVFLPEFLIAGETNDGSVK